MAGRRRNTGKPLRAHARRERRRARLDEELGRAKSDRDRVSAAADYVRAALAQFPNTLIADQVVEDLVEAGDLIFNRGRKTTRG